MLKSFTSVALFTQLGVFMGLAASDYLHGGLDKMWQGLPVRTALFALLMTLFWWTGRRKPKVG